MGIWVRVGWPAILLSLLTLAPFFDKAYTIDDPIMLEGARQVTQDPLHPTAYEIVWTNPERVRASLTVAGSTMMYYLLAPAMLGGAAEWMGHGTQFLLLALGLLGTVSLALRLGLTEEQTRWSALLVASAPAVLAMSGTVMPDVAAMMFAVWAMDRMVAWREEGRAGDGWLAAVLFACGTLSRPHIALLAGPMAMTMIRGGRPDWLRRLWPLAAGFGFMAAFVYFTRDPVLGWTSAFRGPAAYTRPGWAVANGLTYAFHFAVNVPLTIPWILTHYRTMPLWMAGGAAVVTAPVFALGRGFLRQGAIFMAASFWVLGDLARRGLDQRSRVLGVWLLIPLAALPYVHLPAKYVVACAPAAAMLTVLYTRRRWQRAAVAAGTVLGLLILQADAQLAEQWRTGARLFVAPQVAQGRQVWFAGSWGFYWYAQQAGARPLSQSDPQPQPGDIVVVSSGGRYREADRLTRYTVIDSYEDRTPGGRIFRGQPAAGFYSNQIGLWPWAYGRDVINRIEVWRVDR